MEVMNAQYICAAPKMTSIEHPIPSSLRIRITASHGSIEKPSTKRVSKMQQ
jgi:hypothetical protein